MAEETKYIWAFGKKKPLPIDTTYLNTLHDKVIDNRNVSAIKAIVLHNTGGNKPPKTTVGGWNSDAKERKEGVKKIDDENPDLTKDERKAKIKAAKLPPYASADYVLERCPATKLKNPPTLLYKIAPDTISTFHCGLGSTTIGIEMANVGNVWQDNTTKKWLLNDIYNASYEKGGKLNDENAYITIKKDTRVAVFKATKKNAYLTGSFQAYQDAQYDTLILFLRHLCITYDIPRQFLGSSAVQMVTKHKAPLDPKIKKFQGILHHRNVAKLTKLCPGIVHRDRLFRGITEEWWMPCELNGQARTYYSGPFKIPDYKKGEQKIPAYFQWQGTQSTPVDRPQTDQRKQRAQPVVEAKTYRYADFFALCDLKSYYNLSDVNLYYNACERPGGTYPVGANRSWHGGIHLRPPASNAIVYAAASGTIVAARIHSNPETEDHPEFGSQRFVLIKHSVPELGDNCRVNYKGEPKTVYSLYMHLERLEEPRRDLVSTDLDSAGMDDVDADESNSSDADSDVDAPDTTWHNNPPWYNLWLRGDKEGGAGVDQLSNGKGVVFNPNIEVSVGDVLGTAGRFKDDPCCLHFEIFTCETELSIANGTTNPDDEQLSDSGDDRDSYCDDGYLDSVLLEYINRTLDSANVIRVAQRLRNAKSYHISEWAITSKSALQKIYDKAVERDPTQNIDVLTTKCNAQWPHVERFSWWSEASSFDSDLGDGFVWHYHPITFMQCVNENVTADYTKIPVLVGEPCINEDEVSLRVTFTGIRQEPDASFHAMEEAILKYYASVDGKPCSQPVSMKAEIMGTSQSLNGVWKKTTSLPNSAKLEIRVECYDSGCGDSPFDWVHAYYTKDDDPPWGEGPQTRYKSSQHGTFGIYFVIERLA